MVLAQDNKPMFRKQVLDDKILIGYGLAIGDVDGDKKRDIILADKKQIVWYRNGDWKKTVIAENLTESDNVCVAASDLDGDGKVEIAVGAQWNPGETSDETKSGAVFYLKRTAGDQGLWQPVKLHHEPTVHRMKWMKAADGKHYLVVAPLHGRGNKQGEGRGAKILAYEFPADVNARWKVSVIDSSLHLTHNFALFPDAAGITQAIFLASKEGIRLSRPLTPATGNLQTRRNMVTEYPLGEISIGDHKKSPTFFATIEPMHGNAVVVYETTNGESTRTVLDSSLKEGHGLAAADLLSIGTDQVIAGWRQPDINGKTGMKIYSRNKGDKSWKISWFDEGGIAVEDLQVADLNGDGRADVIASGRSTHNVVVYWNETGGSQERK